MEIEYPKILLISHNLYDNSNNVGKTLLSLLLGWPKDKIAQIYFRNDTPSFVHCDNYYLISDKEVFKSVISFGVKKAGHKVDNVKVDLLSNTENKLYKIGNKRKPLISLVRDLLWAMAHWKNKNFYQWIQDFSPDIILFVPNDYSLAYRVALYVESVIHKPIIPFYMDDAFYFDMKVGLIDSIRRKRLRKFASKIHRYCNKILTICDTMSDVYEKHFGLPCKAYVNSVKISNLEFADPHEEIVVSYIGNLHSNRWKGVIEIAEAIDSIIELEYKICFKIYSASILDKSVLRKIKSYKCIDYVGAIPAEMVREKQLESDILVYVEAFDKKSKASTMLSLSTKIPEYLNAGRCIFAYGPKEIAAMRYLSDNNISQICNAKEDLNEKLLQIICSVELRNEFAIRGYNVATERHDILKNSLKFKNELLSNELG